MNMKQLFPEYFINEDKISEIWNDCLFVFDANFLCDFYRYSDVTRVEFINIMNEFSERVWLPNRAVEEYLRNRRTVIKKQEALYLDVIKKLNTLEENLNHKKQHPFVNKKLHGKFSDVSKQLKEELEGSRVEYIKRINGEDEIKNKIVEIFDGKVGASFTDEKLNGILEEGELRYKNKIPPGYKDKEKDDYENQCLTENDKKIKPYGDLIIWKQIIEKADKDKKNIIFVTSDSKEDWWKLEGPNTLGPRGELVKEFEEQTGKLFHMYSPDRFLKFAQEYLKVQVNEDALEEIKEIKEEDERKFLKKIKNKEDKKYLISEITQYSLEDYINDKKNYYEKLKSNELKRNALYSELLKFKAENYRLGYMIKTYNKESEDEYIDLRELMDNYNNNEISIDKIKSSISDLEIEIESLKYNVRNNNE